MILENRGIRLDVDEATGALVSFYLKDLRCEMLGERRLAANFRLCVPRDDYLCNYVDGMAQGPASVTRQGNRITVAFTGLTAEKGPVDIDLSYSITLEDESVSFRCRLTNRGELPVSELWFPRLGGWTGFANNREAKLAVPGYLHCRHEAGLFKAFPGGKGLGSEAAEFQTDYPGMMMPWWEIHDDRTDTGLTLGYLDTTFRFSTWHCYLCPSKSGRPGDAWLGPEDAGALPVGLVFSHVRYPFVQKGESFESGEFVVRLHDGDWHSGSLAYRDWFMQHFPFDKSRSWLRKKSAWFSSIIYQPEDRVITDYEGYDSWCKDANAYGVSCHELLGWDSGGIERNYPDYVPEEKLGGRPAFRKLLKSIDRRGDRCLVFVNYNVLDSCSAWYKRELQPYTHQNLFGQTPNWMSWGESTLLARKQINARRHLLGSVVPPLVKALEDRLLELVRDGAHGFQIDKLCVCSALDFNPLNTEKPDVALCEGLVRAIGKLLEKCRAINPDFCLASEAVQDRLLPFVDVYYRNSSGHDISPLRYVFPEWTSCQHVGAPLDFNGVNGAILTGSVIDVEPEMYSASLAHPAWKRTAEYIREVERLRTELRDLIFLGKYYDTVGAQVTPVAGEGLHYAVHGTNDGTMRAIVVINESTDPVRYSWHFAGEKGKKAVLHAPFAPAREITEEDEMEIPGEGLQIICGNAALS